MNKSICVTFANNDYFIGGKVFTGSPIESRRYFIKEGEVVVKFNNALFLITEREGAEELMNERNAEWGTNYQYRGDFDGSYFRNN